MQRGELKKFSDYKAETEG